MKMFWPIHLMLFAFLSIQAQDVVTDEINHLACCRSGVNFVKDLPPAVLMDGVGTSDLAINTTSKKTQAFFSQGVSLLHCFWDLEAFRSFKEAIRYDSTAIMPYWGLVHTILFIDNEEFDADKDMALAKLKELADSTEGTEAYYARGIMDMAETRNPEGYKKFLEYIVREDPGDTDAKLFLALINMSGNDAEKKPNPGHTYSEFLLRDLLRTDPGNHGVHHYWIHQVEHCCPEEALESARIMDGLAPGSGHIVHMPGHIYNRLGDYKAAHDQFIKAMKVDSAYMSEQDIKEVDNWNYVHNINYLVSNCVHDGRYGEGIHFARRLEGMVADASRAKRYRGAFFYQGIIVPAFMEMRFGFWDRAIEKLSAISDPDSIYGEVAMMFRDALLFYAEGIAAAESGNVETAERFRDKLDALFWRSSQEPPEEEAMFHTHLISDLNILSIELAGAIQLASGNLAAGIELLEKAAEKEHALGYSEPPAYPRPIAIRLGEAYLLQEDHGKAEECFEKLLEDFPNSALGLRGLMKVYKDSGDEAAYADARSRFEEVTKYGDPSVYD